MNLDTQSLPELLTQPPYPFPVYSKISIDRQSFEPARASPAIPNDRNVHLPQGSSGRCLVHRHERAEESFPGRRLQRSTAQVSAPLVPRFASVDIIFVVTFDRYRFDRRNRHECQHAGPNRRRKRRPAEILTLTSVMHSLRASHISCRRY
jgi:hypothetical protein